jgi:hypothetical protein
MLVEPSRRLPALDETRPGSLVRARGQSVPVSTASLAKGCGCRTARFKNFANFAHVTGQGDVFILDSQYCGGDAMPRACPADHNGIERFEGKLGDNLYRI